MPKINNNATVTVTEAITAKANDLVAVNSAGTGFTLVSAGELPESPWQEDGSDVSLRDATDNVGIGTDSPAKKLHVQEPTGEATIRIQSATFYSDIYQSGRNLFIQCAPTDGNIIFYDDSAERMRIDSDGEVGIGTNDPTALLDVDGDAIFNKSALDKDFRVVSDDNQNMLFVDGGTDRVGVGTGTPAKDLHILRASGETTLRLDSGGSYSDFYQSGANLFIQNAAGGGTIRFYDDSAERMRIDSDGNVGIGVSDPDTTLEVLDTTTQLKLSYDADSLATITVADASHTTIATGESGNLILDSAGGIELNADAGTVAFMDATVPAMTIDMATTSGDAIFKDAGGTEIFRIDGSADSLLMGTGKKIEFADSGESISSTGSDLAITSGNDIVLTPTGDIVLYGATSSTATGAGIDAAKVSKKTTDVSTAGGVERVTVLEFDFGGTAYSSGGIFDAIGVYGAGNAYFVNLGDVSNLGYVYDVNILCHEAPVITGPTDMRVAVMGNSSSSIDFDGDVETGTYAFIAGALASGTNPVTDIGDIYTSRQLASMTTVLSAQEVYKVNPYLYFVEAGTQAGGFTAGKFRITITGKVI